MGYQQAMSTTTTAAADSARLILQVAEVNRLARRKAANSLITGLLTVLTIISVSILFIIVFNVFQQGIGAINLDFFIREHQPAGVAGGGIAQAILGTLEMLAISAAVSVPLGVLVAVFLAEYGRGWFAGVTRFVVDLLLQMPSIVIGIFVWSTLVSKGVTIGDTEIRLGFSGWAGAVAMMVIMTPIVVRSVEEILRLVPDILREAGLALGLPRWRVVLRIVVPTVLPGIVTGVILSMARAAGETAPILLTALGNDFINTDMTQPMAAIPLQIYTYATQPDEGLKQKAWAATLVLILVIAIFSATVRTFAGRMKYES
jgi:phosphate transport system permease protein